jgi:lysophospholipase L1-like esterase
VPKTFLALGDSYTVGEGVAASERWPARLAVRLRAAGIALADPRVVARTGWTTDELAAAMDAANLAPPWALATLAIGVNDQYRGRAVDEYRRGFGALLARAVALTGGHAAHVLVVSIPDWGVTPFAAGEGHDPAQLGREIDAFNAAAKADVAVHGARWVDVTRISRASAARAEIGADGLHPSAAQHARWVDAIAPAARAALSGDATP